MASTLKRKRGDAAPFTSSKRHRSPSADLYDQVLGGDVPLAAEEPQEDDDNVLAPTIKPVSQAELERYNAKVDRSGCVQLRLLPST
jgi:hypothetical protein